MKVLHVVNSLNVGGLEQMVISLAKVQKQLGYEVAIASLQEKGYLATSVERMGISVLCAEKGNNTNSLRSVFLLRKAIRTFAPRIIHTHNAVPHYYTVLASRGLLNDARFINTRHDMGQHAYTIKAESLYKLAMHWTKFGVSVCNAAQREFLAFRSFPLRKARVVINGISLNQFDVKSPSGKPSLCESLNIPKSTWIIGTIGRLAPIKDQGLLIDAMSDLCKHISNACLVIVGDGPSREALEKKTAELNLTEKVFFLGRRNDVASLLSGMDIFVQSSITEGYSMALVEAAAAGLPVIATDVGGNGEIVQQGITGILIQAATGEKFSKAISFLIASEKLRQEMSQNAIAWAQANGSIEQMAAAYSELYRESIA